MLCADLTHTPQKKAFRSHDQEQSRAEKVIDEIVVENAAHFLYKIEHGQAEHHIAHTVKSLVHDRQHDLYQEHKTDQYRLRGKTGHDENDRADKEKNRQIEPKIRRENGEADHVERNKFDDQRRHDITADIQ